MTAGLLGCDLATAAESLLGKAKGPLRYPVASGSLGDQVGDPFSKNHLLVGGLHPLENSARHWISSSKKIQSKYDCISKIQNMFDLCAKLTLPHKSSPNIKHPKETIV